MRIARPAKPYTPKPMEIAPRRALVGPHVGKTFAGTKSLNVIRKQCAELGLVLHDSQWRSGSDYVLIEGGGARVHFNTFNGTFFGRTPDGTSFDSRETYHECERWFQQLLSFFYIEKPQAAQPKAS